MEKVVYKKSLAAKLILEQGLMLDSYQALKDLFASYQDIDFKPSFYKERIVLGKTNIGLIKGFKKNLVVYLSLNPNKISKKYGVSDVSDVLCYKKYPTKLIIETEKDLNSAIELFVKELNNLDASDKENYERIDYSKVYYERSFDELLNEGLIKEYVRKYFYVDYSYVDNTETSENPILEDIVTVKYKVMVRGNKTDTLYLLSNYTNWDIREADVFTKENDIFTLTKKYPKNYDLEFKVSYSKSWDGVEKGMFGEEIVNHHYVLDNDKTIEDIVYNFRNN